MARALIRGSRENWIWAKITQLLAKGHIPAEAMVIYRTVDFNIVRLELHHVAEKGSEDKRQGGIKGVYLPVDIS
jgi:hypothetical protein